MKKLISLLLTTLMLFSVVAPAATAAAADADDTPIVMIRGNGNQLYKIDENGNEVEIPSNTDGMGDKIAETAINILIPFLTEGLLQDKWDNYYDVVYEEFAPIYEEMRLDGNGNPQYNSGISASDKWSNSYYPNYDPLTWKQNYGYGDFTYWYDWRLDPYDVVDGFFEYIKSVSETTGRKVTVVGNCMGGAYVYALLEKYCTGENPIGLQYIDRVFFLATVANGTAVLTDVFCGDIKIDAAGLQRYLDELVDGDTPGAGLGLLDTTKEINEVILTTVDLLVQLGAVDALGMTFDEIYAKVYEVLVPMLAIAFYGTMPGYWALLQSDRYEEAKNFMFATEEYRTEYAGLIEKIDNYHEKVGSRRYEIIAECQANGLHIGASAKYGKQMYPFVDSQNMFADEQASFYEASFGATTAATVYDVLPDAHIQAAIAGGTDKYISLDKKVDASTSLLKDTLWIEKNVSHDDWDYDYKVIETFSREKNLTVWDDPSIPQYAIYLPGTEDINSETGQKVPYTGDIVPMTPENCDLTNWDEIPEINKTEEPNLFTKLMSFFRWLIAMIEFLVHISNENPGKLEDALN